MIIEVRLTDTLMAYNNYLEAHVSSGERYSTYFFRVPDTWKGLEQEELDRKAMEVMHKIYNDLNEQLRQAEPDDINYLAPMSVSCHALSEDEEKAKPWLTAGSPAIWEWTPCVVVDEDGNYKKVTPEEF